MASLLDLFSPIIGGESDIEKNAMQRYRDLTDFSSPYWAHVSRYLHQQLSQSTPTADTFAQYSRMGGESGSNSGVLGYQQYKASQNRANDAANKTLLQAFMSSQGEAGQSLQTAGQAYGQRNAGAQSFLDQLLGLGGGLLLRGQNKNTYGFNYMQPYQNEFGAMTPGGRRTPSEG